MSAASPDAARQLFIDPEDVITRSTPFVHGPTAFLSLTVFLMPEAAISHYEIEGRTSEGKLTCYWSTASTEPFDHDASFVQAQQELVEHVRHCLIELETVYGHQLTLDDAGGTSDPAEHQLAAGESEAT